MPDYKYHLKNGKVMTLTGDTQPSDDEVEALAKQNNVELLPADTIIPNKETDMKVPPSTAKSESIDLPKPIPNIPPGTPPYMIRPDGSLKGKGFYGDLKLPNGAVASEYSIADSEDLKDEKGNYLDYPSLVPGLSKDEIDAVLKSASDSSGKTKIPDSVIQKATAFALSRKAKGLPLFATKDEEGKTAMPSPPGLMSRLWHAASEPLTDLPSRFAQSVSDAITQPNANTEDNLWTRAKGFGAGAIEGLGNVASSMTSPINLAMMAASGGSSTAAKAGLWEIADGLKLAQKIGGLPMIAEGGEQVINPHSTWGQRGMGLAEIAGGLSGMTEGMPSEHMPSAPIDPNVEWGVKPPTSNQGIGAAKEPISPELAGAKPMGKVFTEEATKNNINKAISDNPLDSTMVDPYAVHRAAPIGTKFTMSPDQIRGKIGDFIKLGYDYRDMTDDGKIIMQKTKESPSVTIPENKPSKANPLLDAFNAPRTIMASMDFSAPLRQGLGLIHKPEFWTSLPSMFKAFGSEESFKGTMQSIAEKPFFQKTVAADGTIKPSFAQQAGLKLTGFSDMGQREESFMSHLAEKIPGIKPSERAYTAFLNKLRADTFEQMVTDYSKYNGVVPTSDLATASQIADYVNAASGRGKMSVSVAGHKYSAEPAAKVLSSVLFSPRLLASRLQMMGTGARAVFDPTVYMLSQPSIRREYLKSLFAIAATSQAFVQLGKLAGGTVESDPSSSDFGKLKFGDTRIDPYGGFQQPVVLAQRLMPQLDLSSIGLGKIGGHMKSTTTNREYDVSNPGYGQSNRADILGRFIRSKTNPIINFAWGLADAGKKGPRELSGQPMNFTTMNPMDNSIAQRFLPMLSQDIYDLIKDQKTPVPAKFLAGTAAVFGMGSQTYTGNPAKH